MSATIAAAYGENAARLLRSPDDPQALVDMFACLSNHGRGEHRRHHLVLAQRAWRIAPQEPNVVFNYASALGRCGRPRIFATKANYAREIQQNTQLGAQITQSFGGLKRLGEHGLRLLGRAPRVKQTVPKADLQPHLQSRVGR